MQITLKINFVNDGILRIARKPRMGLFDKNKNKVLLSSNYSNIEKLDDEHLILSVGKKEGLYSLKYRRIIVPINMSPNQIYELCYYGKV